MKRFIIIIIMVLLITSQTISAQRMLPKQKGIEVNSGKIFTGNLDNYFINAGLIIHSKKGNYMLYALEYSREDIPYQTYEIPVESITAEAAYSFNCIANRGKSLMVNFTLAAVAGYEIINRDNHLLYDGSLLTNDSSLIYGAGGKLSIESYLSDRFIIIVSGRTKVLWNIARNQIRPSVGIGLRINL